MRYLILIAMLLPLAAFSEPVGDLGTAMDQSDLAVDATQQNVSDDLNLQDEASDSFNFYRSYYPFFYYGYYPFYSYYPYYYGFANSFYPYYYGLFGGGCLGGF